MVVNWDLEVLHQTTLFNPGVNKFTFNGTERKKMTNQYWQQLNLSEKLSAYLGSLFLWPCFPLHTCARGWSFFHCDKQLVVVRVLVERGLASLMIQRHLLEGYGAKQEA
jgi:hypothetical protein